MLSRVPLSYLAGMLAGVLLTLLVVVGVITAWGWRILTGG
jgi:hypothetical protein